MFQPVKISGKWAKDAHGLQRNKLLLGFAWVKYVLVEWHLYFRIMGPDQFLTRITGVFGHIHMSAVHNSLFTVRRSPNPALQVVLVLNVESIVIKWSVSRYLVMNSIKERFDSMDGAKSEAVQKIQERF